MVGVARLGTVDLGYDDVRTVLSSGHVAAGRRRIVTFLKAPPRQGPELPHEKGGSTVLAGTGR